MRHPKIDGFANAHETEILSPARKSKSTPYVIASEAKQSPCQRHIKEIAAALRASQ
jgi:hypothetical protein